MGKDSKKEAKVKVKHNVKVEMKQNLKAETKHETKQEPKHDTKGITAKKEEDFGEWYSQLLLKAELIEYSPISGCYVLRPNCYFIWEQAQAFFDQLIKKDGVKNAYFPMLIPESLLKKESKHVKGFAPEVAWVDYGGDTKLSERLAIRPTSETIMYDSYSKWIRSYKDLPLRINQWCNVVRWEFKHPMPLLRSREFLWQEGHTVFASKKEAVEEALHILEFYAELFEELYAVPVLKGQKAESEKFAGADATYSIEAFLPNGKAIQGATSHNLGQHFAKVFGISFLDKKQQRQFGWQNSWGVSTRSVGVMILQHSDAKGLVLPPKVAPVQVVVVPITFDDSKARVLAEAEKIRKELSSKGIRVHLDERDGYTPGWKFNEWELRGVPIRIEIGPKDLEKKQVVLARRDNGEKKALPLVGLGQEVESLLPKIQTEMLKKAQKHLEFSKVSVESLSEAKKEIETGKLLFVPWCESEECEEYFKSELGGAKSLNAPFAQPKLKPKQRCFACDNPAKRWFYVGKSY